MMNDVIKPLCIEKAFLNYTTIKLISMQQNKDMGYY